MSWLIAVKVPTNGKTVCAKTKFMPPWAMYGEAETKSAARLLCQLLTSWNPLRLRGGGSQDLYILLPVVHPELAFLVPLL